MFYSLASIKKKKKYWLLNTACGSHKPDSEQKATNRYRVFSRRVEGRDGGGNVLELDSNDYSTT